MEQLWQDFISWLSTTGLDTIISWLLFIPLLTLFILRRVKFRKSIEHLSFKEYKKSLKKNKK